MRVNLQLGIEKFCPSCGYNLNKGQIGESSLNFTDNEGDILGSAFTGDKNIIAKDTKGNIFYFNIDSISTEQFENIMTTAVTLDTSSTNRDTNNANINNLNQLTKTKLQTSLVLDEIYKIEKENGRAIEKIQGGRF